MAKAKVQIAVDDGSGTICPGSVKRLSLRAALGIFRQDACPPLDPGRLVHLILSSSSTQELLGTEATVQQVTAHPPFQVVVFRFTEEQPRARALIDTQARSERRTVDRIAPGAGVTSATLGVPREIVPLLPGIPGAAIFQDDDIHVPGTVEDLSVHGAALLVDRGVEIAFVASDRVLVTLRLAQGQEPLVIAGRIRHRQDRPGQLVYGIAFDWDATEDRWARQEILAQQLAGLTAQPDRRSASHLVADPRRASDIGLDHTPVEPLHPSATAPAAGLQGTGDPPGSVPPAPGR